MHFPLQDLSGQSPRSPEDAKFTYNMDDISAVTDVLGIPWELSKDVPFSSETPFTGLLWNFETRVVSIPTGKALRYLDAIRSWKGSRAHTLEEVQKLYGKLLHAALVVPPGRAYLTGLEAMLGVFSDSPHKPHTPPKGTEAELAWWTTRLSSPISRPIPGLVDIHDVGAFSDTSSSVGVGIVLRGRWRAWRLLPGWATEAVGFELLICSILRAPLPPGAYRVKGDNRGVVEGWWNNRSRSPAINGVFRHIHSALDQPGFSIHLRYVSTNSNPANTPSRGVYPCVSILVPPVELTPDLRDLLVDFNAPIHDAEVGVNSHRRAKPKPTPGTKRSRALVNDAFNAIGNELSPLTCLRPD